VQDLLREDRVILSMEKWKGMQKKRMIFTNFINTNTERIIIFYSDRIFQVITLINSATSENTRKRRTRG
jgi:hypothetical protein